MIFYGVSELLVLLCGVVTGFLSFKGPVIMNLLLSALVLLLTHLFLGTEGLGWAEAGLKRDSSALKQLLTGTLAGIGMLLVVAKVITLIVGLHWALNPAFHWIDLGGIFITVFCSAFAQELAFRGYPFFLMMRKWGEWPAQLVTAFFFGCMHLHEGMSWHDIFFVLLSTGIGSLLFGMATIRTGKIYLATGIHFGWNFLQYLLPRSPGENGQGSWIVTGGRVADMGLMAYMLPYVIIIALAYFIIRRRKGAISG